MPTKSNLAGRAGGTKKGRCCLMCRWWARALMALLAAVPVAAQTTTLVSGAVRDPAGLPYALAQVQAALVDAAGAAVSNPSVGGTSISSTTLTGTDGAGAFSLTLSRNGSITPANTRWRFQVCLLPGASRPAGAGSLCFTVLPLTVAGTTQDVSGEINAAAPYIQAPAATFNAEIMDRFARADATNLGPDWSPQLELAQSPPQVGEPCIVTQLARACAANFDYYHAIYTARALPANQYAQLRIADVTGTDWEISVVLRATPASAAAPQPSIREYFCSVQRTVALGDTIVCSRWIEPTISNFLPVTTVTPTWIVGDVIRVDAVTLLDGTVELRWYRNSINIQNTVDTTPLLDGRYAGVAISSGSLVTGFNNFTAGQSLARPSPLPTTVARLGLAVNGEQVFCSDCTFANPCAGGGTGAIAKRLNGAWRCD